MNGASAAVVGAGIVGRMVAWRLVRAGCRVTVFDRAGARDGGLAAGPPGPGELGACSFAAAGLLAPVAEAVAAADPRLHDVGQASRALWRTFAADHQLSDFPQSFSGTLALARASESAELADFQAKVRRVIPDARTESLSRDQLGRLEPDLSGEAFEALLVSEEGHVDAPAALRILGDALARAADLRPGVEVTALSPHAVQADGRVESFGLVVDARGLGAKRDLAGLRGVRGEIVEVRAPEVRLTRPVRVLHQRYPIYVVPRGKDRYAIGATSIECESLAPVSVKATLELLGAAYALHPGFRYAEVTGLFAQARPAFDDHWPRVAHRPGLVSVNGLYRHGFLLSPLIAEVVMRLIVNGVETEAGTPQHLAELLDRLGYSPDRVAVALNKDFVPRSRLVDTAVSDGDRVEVLAPMAGG